MQPNGNTETMEQYLCSAFSKDGTYDDTATQLVRQRKVRHWMDRPPEEKEVLSAIAKMNNNECTIECAIEPTIGHAIE